MRRRRVSSPVMRYDSDQLYPIYLRQGRSPKRYKAGFINRAGDTVIEPQFEDASPFSDGLASVQMNGMWGAINPSGQLVIPCVHALALQFADGVSQCENGPRRGLLASDGSVILRPKYWAI